MNGLQNKTSGVRGKNMKTNENYKIAAERVKRANKKISDAQIETICESDCLENAERYVYKSQMLEKIEKEKEYIQGVFLQIKEKMLAFNLPIKYIGNNQDITNLTINSEMENNDIYKYVSRHKQLKEISAELKAGRRTESRVMLNKFLKNLNALYEQCCEDEKGIIKGEEGEQAVADGLKLYTGKYHYRENVILPANDIGGETSETDVYIVTSKAVFVCEVKNWGKRGRTICISKDGQWSVKGRKIQLKSPIQQNTRHCLATERYLESHGINDYKIVPLIIMTNEDVKIENESDNNIIRVSELYNFIEGLDLPEKYTDQQQKEVLKLFDSSNVSERKFKIISPSVNKEKIDNQITLIFEWIQDEEVWKTALNNYFDDVRKMELKEQKKEDVQFKLLMVIPIIIAIICVLFLGLYMLEMHPVITVFLGIVIVGGVLQIIFEKI